MVEYLWKTFPYQYFKFSKKRETFFRTLKLMHAFEHKKKKEVVDEPFFIINLLAASELSLKTTFIAPEKGSTNEYKQYCKMQEYEASHKLKLINFDEFDEILVDFDRYVKNSTRRSFSTVYSYMKANKLSSLLHSKPAEESVFRFMNIRVRVYIYELMNKFTESFKSSDRFFDKLRAAGLDASAQRNDLTLDRQGQKIQRTMSKYQRALQLAVMDTLLKNTWSSNEILSGDQCSRLTSWLNSTKLPEDFGFMNPRYNIALYNRLLNMGDVYGDFLMQNNRILSSMARHAYWQGREVETEALMSKALEMNGYTQELIYRKACSIAAEWEREYLDDSNDFSVVGKQQDRMLLSLKMAIKYCQMIMIVVRYNVELSGQSRSVINFDSGTSEVQLLNNLASNTNDPFSLGQSQDSSPESKEKYSIEHSFLQYFMTKLLRNHVLRSAKFKELDSVLRQFRETTKKDQDGVIKNAELDHLVSQQLHFCQMAASMAQMRKTVKNRKASIELTVEKEMLQSYLDTAAESSFLSANKFVLETNLAGLMSEVVKCFLKEQTEVFKDMSLAIAKKKPTKKRLKPEKRIRDNLCSNIMANNGNIIFNQKQSCFHSW